MSDKLLFVIIYGGFWLSFGLYWLIKIIIEIISIKISNKGKTLLTEYVDSKGCLWSMIDNDYAFAFRNKDKVIYLYEMPQRIDEANMIIRRVIENES